MTAYGGLGGVSGGRPFDPDDAFEAAVNRALGDRLRACEARGWYAAAGPYTIAEQLWGALANRDWTHTNGDTAGYSFRAAGDLIAAVRGSGDYMDWYCSGPEGTVSDEIAAAMAREGWAPDPPEART